MKKHIVLLGILGFCMSLPAQVPKKVIVEHFTNTLCSVCAGRNPGFRNNLNAQDSNVLYISYHPSSPYVNCIMNKSNVRENDGRTKFYGVYGSTPRLVIQGSVIPVNANYNVQGLFDPYLNQTSPVSMRIRRLMLTDEMMVFRIVIKTVAAHSLDRAKLYVALAEDTIDYNAPNGEKKHYHVFRKAIYDSTGLSLNIPANINDSIIKTITTPIPSGWKAVNLMQFAILQDSASKQVIQAAALKAEGGPGLGIKASSLTGYLTVYPNPAGGMLFVNIPVEELDDAITNILDMTGRPVFSGRLEKDHLDISALEDGIYMIRIHSSRFSGTALFRKEN